MARYVNPDYTRVLIDETIESWKERCLLSDGSLLFDDREIWTIYNLEDFRERFLGNPLYGTELTFDEKLELQLDGASDEVRWLVCELMAVHFLFARGAINGDAKREKLCAIVAPLEADDPPHWEHLARTMDEGIGHPGLGYNISRDQQVGYLIDFCLRFKSIRDVDERKRLLSNPWALRDFADDASDEVSVREMRHILLHLLRPDDFERMSSRTHKQNIVAAFADELLPKEDRPDDVDEQILMIRERLVEMDAQPDSHQGILDFYGPPLDSIWDWTSDRADGASDLDLLLYKKQMVLYGPPGTGKTFRTRDLAKRLIHRVALEKWKSAKFFTSQDELAKYVEENIHWVQLHPGYGYEEFIRGLRLSNDGSTEYVDGLLPRLVDRIESVPEDERLPVVLVLDEINRTDLSRLFGEAFSLLENRDTPAILPGVDESGISMELRLPRNLFVIGTMNLIDQSVEELDFALRRRFFWRPAGFEKEPIVLVNEMRWSEHAPPKWGWDRAVGDMTLLADRAELLNREIARSPHLGPQYELGHTYFFDAAFFAGRWLHGMKSLQGGVLWTKAGSPRESINDLWKFSLEPLLTQYLGGLEADVVRDELERLRKVLMLGLVE